MLVGLWEEDLEHLPAGEHSSPFPTGLGAFSMGMAVGEQALGCEQPHHFVFQHLAVSMGSAWGVLCFPSRP